MQDRVARSFIAFRLGRHLGAFEAAGRYNLVCQIGFDDWRNDIQVQGIDLVQAG